MSNKTKNNGRGAVSRLAGAGTGTGRGAGRAHPLSIIPTQLVWEGKYDGRGVQRGLDRESLSYPFRQVERVEPGLEGVSPRGAQEARGVEAPDQGQNLLIMGDNKLVMASLLEEYAGKVDLIYIDPPFDVGTNFSVNLSIGEGGQGGAPDASRVPLVAYRDVWGKSTDSYLHFMYERLVLIKELLAESGNLYVHCDWRVSAYLRVMLDEIFGRKSFLNEIVWSYALGGSSGDMYQRKHDTIYFYAKNPARAYFNQPRDKATSSLLAGQPKGARDVWRTSYEDDHGHLLDAWPDDMVEYTISNRNQERVGYPTQKPEAVLERIVHSSCPPGGLVMDVFCGSGTTGVVAERMGRRWIMADMGRLAIHVTKKRVLQLHQEMIRSAEERAAGRGGSGDLGGEGRSVPLPRGFRVLDVGAGERRWWARTRVLPQLEEAEREGGGYGAGGSPEAVRQGGCHREKWARAMLTRFGAVYVPLDQRPLKGVQGMKEGAGCAVAGPGTTVNTRWIRKFLRELEGEPARADHGVREIFILAWEFGEEVRSYVDYRNQKGVFCLRPVRIPRDLMYVGADTGVLWPEVPRVEVRVVQSGGGEAGGDQGDCHENRGRFRVELLDFKPSYVATGKISGGTRVNDQMVPTALESGADGSLDLVDGWSVDFQWSKDGPFCHRWSSFRSRNDRALQSVSGGGAMDSCSRAFLRRWGLAPGSGGGGTGAGTGTGVAVMVVDALGFEWVFPL